MYDIEVKLLSKILFTGDLKEVSKFGVKATYFSHAETKSCYTAIFKWFNAIHTKGDVPTLRMMQNEFPSLPLKEEPRDTIRTLCRTLVDDHLRRELEEGANDAVITSRTHPREALEDLSELVKRLSVASGYSRDIDLSTAHADLLSEYFLVKDSMGLLGMPWPWNTMNTHTLGMQDGEFIVIYARPKSKKTWLILYMACHCYMHANARVLFYTKEMAPSQICRRTAAILTGLDYGRYIKGELSNEEEKMFEDVMTSLAADERDNRNKRGSKRKFIITSDSDANAAGLIGLEAKIEELEPDIVFIDGLYLMKDDRTGMRSTKHGNITNITQDTKLLALRKKVPIVVTTQANREGDEIKGSSLRELGYSDSFGQDADILLRVMPVDHPKSKIPLVVMKVSGAREMLLDAFVVNGQPASNFGEYATSLTPDIADAAGMKAGTSPPSKTSSSYTNSASSGSTDSSSAGDNNVDHGDGEGSAADNKNAATNPRKNAASRRGLTAASKPKAREQTQQRRPRPPNAVAPRRFSPP